MKAYWKRGYRAAMSAAATTLLLAVFLAACGDSEPTLATDSEPTLATEERPTPTSASTDATAPPGVRTAQPTLAASGVPSQTSAAAPAPKPPGYLHGAEHGISLLQTARKPSKSREGWVDIRLTLATLKFAGDVDDRDYEVDENSLCYLNSQPPHDCLFVAWGNEEQFEAEISASHPSEEFGWLYKTDFLFIEFEVAANATNASLFFGEQHKIPLNLRGDEVQVVPYAEPAPAPVPPSSSDQPTGYFMDAYHGIAIINVETIPWTNDDVSELYPEISLVSLDISILSLTDDEALAPEIEVDEYHPEVCFGGGPEECLKVLWGAENQFHAGLDADIDRFTEWPRGKGLPVKLRFVAPNFVEEAMIEFGQHRIPIDLRGMTGETPAWDYKLHYPELQVGSMLYDSNNKTVVLDGVRHEEDTGDVTLVFSATNNSEATDFAPVLELAGSRVSESGTVFDKYLDRVEGWTPHTIRIEAGALPPGGSRDLELHIPRSESRDWDWIPYTSAEEDRPDAAVFQIEVTDSLSDANPQVSAPVYALFESRNQEDALFERKKAERILFESDRLGDWEIYAMNSDGFGIVQLTHNSANDRKAAWSPDGRRIAFDSDRDGDWEIYAMNSDGSGVIQLTHNSANDKKAAWSPDGRRIAFHSDRDGDLEIYAMNSDGSGVIQLTDNSSHDRNAAWSPDGRRIAFYSLRDGVNWEIYAMNSDGSGVIQLTDNPASDGFPDWSPDGSRIVFHSDRDGGDYEIYTMNPDGSVVVQLTHNSADDDIPAWSPDGRRIAFQSDRDGDSEIYAMNSDGSGVMRLTHKPWFDVPTDWALVVVE